MYKQVELNEILPSIKAEQPLAFDTETNGKYGKICLAQFYQEHWQDALVVRNPQPIILMSILAQLNDTPIIMQNASYDISTIQRQTGSRFIPHLFEDTLLLARINWPALDSYTLDKLLRKALGYDPYKNFDIDKKIMQKANWAMPTIQQFQYASIDVYYLLDLYNKVKCAETSFSYKLDMLSLREALDWQNNGMCVNKDRLNDMYILNIQKIHDQNLHINANSYVQVRPYIGSDNSNGLGLATLALQGNERANQVNIVRKLLKQNSFLDKFDTLDNKIYGIFGPYARSGRYTCQDQNLQQIPRLTKSIFTCEQDRYMLYSDFSQLELRSIAAITGDKRMVNLYKINGDVHNLVRDQLSIPRVNAKTINFNGLYGGGAGMMRGILIKDANILMDFYVVASELRKWKNLFPSIAAWQQKGIRDYNGGRLGSTACGRKYRGRMMTDQLNIENQGTGAEIAKLAMHYMYSDLKELDCHIQDFIHDSWIIDTPNDKVVYTKAAKIMAKAMQEAWHEVSQLLKVKDIPMPVKVLGGYHWGDIEEGSYTFKYEVE